MRENFQRAPSIGDWPSTELGWGQAHDCAVQRFQACQIGVGQI
jgi:hypothetical protein